MGVDRVKDIIANLLNNQVSLGKFSVHIMELSIIWSYRGLRGQVMYYWDVQCEVFM